MAAQKNKRTTTSPKSAKARSGAKRPKTTTDESKPPRILKASKATAATDVATVSLADTSSKRLSALDAAALVLAESPEPMNCRQMIEVMAAQGYWTSPGGKTPASTLYAAILKEIVTKDKASRFRKIARGKFARN